MCEHVRHSGVIPVSFWWLVNAALPVSESNLSFISVLVSSRLGHTSTHTLLFYIHSASLAILPCVCVCVKLVPVPVCINLHYGITCIKSLEGERKGRTTRRELCIYLSMQITHCGCLPTFLPLSGFSWPWAAKPHVLITAPVIADCKSHIIKLIVRSSHRLTHIKAVVKFLINALFRPCNRLCS